MNARRADIPVPGVLSETDATQVEAAFGVGREQVERDHLDEIWYSTEGSGRMRRQQADHADDLRVEAGVSITIPVGTRFQFRADADRALVAIGITMPPGPGDEAMIVEGTWDPNL